MFYSLSITILMRILMALFLTEPLPPWSSSSNYRSSCSISYCFRSDYFFRRSMTSSAWANLSLTSRSTYCSSCSRSWYCLLFPSALERHLFSDSLVRFVATCWHQIVQAELTPPTASHYRLNYPKTFRKAAFFLNDFNLSYKSDSRFSYSSMDWSICWDFALYWFSSTLPRCLNSYRSACARFKFCLIFWTRMSKVLMSCTWSFSFPRSNCSCSILRLCWQLRNK